MRFNTRSSLAVVLGLALAQPSFAQDEGAQSAPAPAPAAQTETTTTTSMGFGLPAPGTNLEAHLPSSSHAVEDIHQGDTFDLPSPSGVRGGGARTLRGNPGAPGITVDQIKGNTGIYVVRPGDTLSKISSQIYGQPWQWPKLWSLNAQIQNPHWIYPGDQIRLTAVGGTPLKSEQSRTLGAGGGLRTGPAMQPHTVFLNRLGYIDDPSRAVLGEVVGAKEPLQLLSQGQGIYMVVREGTQLHKGQELSIFIESRDPPKVRGARTPPGKIVAIKGTVRVDYYNPETRVVRGLITESLDVIERGAKVGLMERKFFIVPPSVARTNVTARVLTSMYPHAIMSQHQVVFLDRGSEDGLEQGNRLFIIRRGDVWRRTLDTAGVGARTRLLMDVPESLVSEPVPFHGDEQQFPEEVVGELRVLETQDKSALAVVVEATVAVEPGDRAVARTGF